MAKNNNAAKNAAKTQAVSVKNKDVDGSESAVTPTPAGPPDTLSWGQQEAESQKIPGILTPATVSPEQAALLELQESISDAELNNFMTLNQGQFVGKTRQLFEDPLGKMLGCTSYVSRPTKPWARDYKGHALEMVFDREYPQRRTLIDDFDHEPAAEIVDKRRALCAQYGYFYAYATPRFSLTMRKLEEHFDLSKAAIALEVKKLKKLKASKSASDTEETQPE